MTFKFRTKLVMVKKYFYLLKKDNFESCCKYTANRVIVHLALKMSNKISSSSYISLVNKVLG